MSLLNTTTRISAELAESAKAAARSQSSAAVHLNRMGQTLLAADNAALTAWLAAIGEGLDPLLTAHATAGHALNAAQDAAQAVLDASGIAQTLERVDVRSFADRLAEQYRAIDETGTVIDLPIPEPEPEPEP
jgi:hypothetical protein